MAPELKKRSRYETVLAVCFWLLLWQAASAAIGQELFLVSPGKVLATLAGLALQRDFWLTVLFSAGRIVGGFLLALCCGTVLAALAAAVPFLRVLLRPLMVTVRSVPVASFIILALLWLKNAGNLAVFISFLMVLPLVYQNTLTGLCSVDQKLLEMAAVFHFSAGRRARYLYAPAALPYFRTACEVGLGLCWKSGVAAEVIGITAGSIGERLYDAKLLFSTADLLAWTAVIVLLSLGFEKLFLWALGKGAAALLKASPPPPAPPARPTDIRLSGIGKEYEGRSVLAAVDAVFPAGQTVCLMAPSGWGKTTLLQIVLRLVKPDTGAVTPTGLRLAAAFQEDRLLEALSARDNVRLVTRRQQAELDAAFAAVGLSAEEWARPVAQLSGGQRRRVAVVRAMLADGAAAVLLDEPFKGLDEAAQRRTAAFVRENAGARAVVAVTHDAGDAPLLGAAVLAPEPGKKTLTNPAKRA